MLTQPWKWLAPVAVAVLAGCATVPNDAGFGDVLRDVAARTGQHVEWDCGTGPDVAVSQRVRRAWKGSSCRRLRRSRGLQHWRTPGRVWS